MSLEVLIKYKINAKKSLGQNFLINNDIVEEIAESIDVKGKNIVEVGPGYGALTEKLIARKPKSLVLVELDKDMIDILQKRIKNDDFDLDGIDFCINNIDVLKYEPIFYGTDLEKRYSIIANIPYYITSPILRHFLYDVENKPEKMVILMQKDVGDKILGKGKNKSSVISLFVDKKSNVGELMVVNKENFVPIPKVESCVLVFELHDDYKNIDDKRFLEFIKNGFKEPRKILIKNFIKAGYEKNNTLEIFNSLGIDNNIRGEDLNISLWIQLFIKLNI